MPSQKLIASFFVFVLAVAGQAVAAELKLGVIDVEKVVAQSPKGKAGREEMDKLRTAKQAELETVRKEVLDLKKRIDDGRLSLSPDRLQQLQEEYEGKVLLARRAEDDANRELQKRGERLMEEIEAQVLPVIQQTGRELGYTLLFNKYQSGLLYADNAIDITDQVIAKLAQTGSAGG